MVCHGRLCEQVGGKSSVYRGKKHARKIAHLTGGQFLSESYLVLLKIFHTRLLRRPSLCPGLALGGR